MLECSKNHGEFEFFAEKRTVFKKKLPSLSEARGQMRKMRGELKELRADISEPEKARKKRKKKKKPTAPEVHAMPFVASRTLGEAEDFEFYPESVAAAKKGIELGGTLDKIEVENMQNLHEHLYTQYMNPAFMLYLSQMDSLEPKEGVSKKVYDALDLIVKYPFAFDYQYLDNNIIHIVKRRPYVVKGKPVNKDIPNEFKVVLKTDQARIAEVNGIDLEAKQPLMTHEKYAKQMPAYRERFMEALEKSEDAGSDDFYVVLDEWDIGPERTKKLRELLLEPYQNIPPPMQRIFEVEHVKFPKCLISLIEARGLEFEIEDPRFKQLKRNYDRQGKTYEELTKFKIKTAEDVDHEDPEYVPDKYRIIVRAHPEAEEAYLIIMAPDNASEDRGETLTVSKEGYIMEQGPDGKWRPDSRYNKHTIRLRYYEKYPAALADLTDKERKQLAAESEEINKAIGEDTKTREIAKKRDEINPALDGAGLALLAKVAKALASDDEDLEVLDEYLEEGGDEKELRKIIKDTLTDEPDKLGAAAKALGVSFEKTKSKAKKAEAKEAKKKFERVDPLLNEANLDALAIVARSFTTDAKDLESIDYAVEGKYEKELRSAIRDTLKEEPDKLEDAAELLDALVELDKIKDDEKVAELMTIRPKGEQPEKTIGKQKEQLRKWLDEGKITAFILLKRIKEVVE